MSCAVAKEAMEAWLKCEQREKKLNENHNKFEYLQKLAEARDSYIQTHSTVAAESFWIEKLKIMNDTHTHTHTPIGTQAHTEAPTQSC